MLDDARLRAFLHDAGRALLDAGMLRLFELYAGDVWLASYFAFFAQRRLYAYLPGFDPDFARVGPGVLIVGHMIRAAENEGAVAFDFLRGREPYKYRWGARKIPTFRLSGCLS